MSVNDLESDQISLNHFFRITQNKQETSCSVRMEILLAPRFTWTNPCWKCAFQSAITSCMGPEDFWAWILNNMVFFSLLFSALSWCFLANPNSPLDVVQAIYKSNFWNECPTPFRLGLDRKREGWGRGKEGGREEETDHSTYSAAEDKLERLREKIQNV